ncbi:hypothetical protein X777_12214, partial [Ooceraea biroi]
SRGSSRKCHTVRTFGLTAATRALKNEKDDENESGMVVSGRYAKNLKLSRQGRTGREGTEMGGWRRGYGKPKAPQRTI